ncbi:hypothetical protein N9Z85_06940 [Akkermansiaceae bacterium]|jgi:hypothetical protein|nr:hypothetical protein [Akkermansiaceae bacterium]MDB4520442.1 hypothetical protein [Akkermansiaceae bacterium]|tara:strand:+ start:1745 stop:1894 length:150 start_codon:yes stop_codon:yes gene_type:complete
MTRKIITLLAVLLPLPGLTAGELPRLAKELDPKKQSYAAQKKLPDPTEP